jgi:hypothetical protein
LLLDSTYCPNVVNLVSISNFSHFFMTHTWQENYINYRPSSASKDDNGIKRMNLIARAAESIASGDIVNVQIRRYRQWQLSQTSSVASCILPYVALSLLWRITISLLNFSLSNSSFLFIIVSVLRCYMGKGKHLNR